MARAYTNGWRLQNWSIEGKTVEVDGIKEEEVEDNISAVGEETLHDRENAEVLRRVNKCTTNFQASTRESVVIQVSNPKAPTGLPRFRKSNNGIDNPEEFLRQFRIIMMAVDFPEDWWIKILSKQLDLANGRWLERWSKQQGREEHITWKDLEVAFLKQFLHTDYQPW